MLKAKPFTASGSFSVRSVMMSGGNALKGGNPNSIMLSGSPTISIYGFDIPLSFNLSPQTKSFQQPFNQFGASPKYKWVTLHAGYTNLNYNPFTLAGHTIYGMGFDIAPKKFRFGIMKGRLSAATTIDTISQSLQPVSFSRKGIAGHIGFVGNKNSIDLSIVIAEDDSSSVGANLSSISQRYGKEITPAGNAAIGITSKLLLSKNISWEGNYAVSVYTRDVRNPSLNDKLSNTDLRNVSKKLVQVNQSTELYDALQTSIAYKSRLFGLKLRYLRILPDFKSMGAYFINSDVQNLTIIPSAILFKKKLNATGSIGLQKDNLKGVKRTTSNRVIGSLSLNAMLSKKMMIAGNYNNYAINQVANVQRIADTFRVTQSTQNLNITPIYTSIKNKNSNTIMGNLNLNTLNDFNTSYALNAQSRTLKTLTALLSFRRLLSKPKLSYTIGANYTAVNGFALNDKNIGGTLGIDKTLKNDRISIGFTNTILTGKRNNNNTLTASAGLQASAKITKKQHFNFGSFLNHTQIKTNLGNNNITYFRGELAYTLIF